MADCIGSICGLEAGNPIRTEGWEGRNWEQGPLGSLTSPVKYHINTHYVQVSTFSSKSEYLLVTSSPSSPCPLSKDKHSKLTSRSLD